MLALRARARFARWVMQWPLRHYNGLMQSLLVGLVFTAVLAPTLKFDAPDGWVAKTPSSTMRVAEFALPRAATDAEDASLTVYFFGATQGGSVSANIDRWIGQMTQPDGKASKDVAKTSAMESHGLKISLVDLTGTYVAEMSPGATEHFNKPGFRLRAAVVETPGGPYYVKVIGPSATVAKWDPSVAQFLKSLRYE
jgi:hypothetical protein